MMRSLGPEYYLIIAGDASMALSELTMAGGAIDWGVTGNEPGIVWLKRLADHFRRAVWLNPINRDWWEVTEGYHTIDIIRRVFPMFELTLEGLEEAVKKLKSWQ
ncbi:MAG: VWA containing CoxE family protein, partial [Peptococcaceae bacterium]|nr:VWA containing CoxE family protein [Peptococcaceae bacterium]